MIEWHYLNRHDAAEDMENALPRMKKQAVSQHGKGHGDCSEGSFFFTKPFLNSITSYLRVQEFSEDEGGKISVAESTVLRKVTRGSRDV